MPPPPLVLPPLLLPPLLLPPVLEPPLPAAPVPAPPSLPPPPEEFSVLPPQPTPKTKSPTHAIDARMARP